MNEKQKELAALIKAEKDRLPEYSAFGDKTDFDDYDLTIEYLGTGKKPKNWQNYDLLSACIEDFETVYNDYKLE